MFRIWLCNTYYVVLHLENEHKPNGDEMKAESIVKTDARWKLRFQSMWRNTPKNKRRTKQEINKIKANAKLYTSLYESWE